MVLLIKSQVYLYIFSVLQYNFSTFVVFYSHMIFLTLSLENILVLTKDLANLCTICKKLLYVLSCDNNLHETIFGTSLQDNTNKMFVMIDFRKTGSPNPSAAQIKLDACVYKKR